MKAGLYWNYATRSLIRGGQRTLLAIFCVAVGVLAIVSLQLVGNMVNNSLTGNIREGNGGDISVTSSIVPFNSDQLSLFQNLQSQGKITDWTATVVSERAKGTDQDGTPDYFTLRAVDPAKFPLAGAPTFITPSDGSLASVLSGSTVVVSQAFLDQTGYAMGDSFAVHSFDGRDFTVTIGGVVKNENLFRRPQILMSLDTYTSTPSTSGTPPSYSNVYVNVLNSDETRADDVKNIISQTYPQATVTTTKDALEQNEQQVQYFRYFLQIVGLLALLIGGIGIINTMQVLLRRRQTEIAMLKTAGYRRTDLYLLFGLEAAILGIVGGIIGAGAGIGVSFIVRAIVQGVFRNITLEPSIDPRTVASGVAIGFATALIFGLMPIVQASQIRPLAVLRGLAETNRVSSGIQTILLGLLLAFLFFLLAWSILGNFWVSIVAVGGTGLILLGLALVFTLLVLLISLLPVPERFNLGFTALLLLGLLVSVGVWFLVPPVGIILGIVTLVGFIVSIAPRSWKSNVKLSLRNVGRQRARTATTMVALFVGVFGIGLILVLGANVNDLLNTAAFSALPYNSYVVADPKDKATVDAQVSGVQDKKVVTIAQTQPVAVHGEPINQILSTAPEQGGTTNLGRQGALGVLTGVEGTDLADPNTPLPDVTIVKGPNDTTIGRNLTHADAGTNNVIMSLAGGYAPLNLKLGDTITMATQDQKTTETLTIVGFYQGQLTFDLPIQGDSGVVSKLANGNPFYLYSLKLDPNTADATLRNIEKSSDSVQTINLLDLVSAITTLINNIVTMLTAVASLAMLAGVIIIANAVALAMLERRRELGILKSVGFTSRSVLSEVLVENGIVGFTGSVLAMGIVAVALALLGHILFDADFGASVPLVLGIVGATTVVCMLVAGLVAWSATRVRPLEVLRYE